MKGIIFICLFILFAAGGVLYAPHLSVYGYIADYCIVPAKEWWAMPFRFLRFSFTLALCTLVGMIIYWSKLRQGKQFLQSQETLLLTILGIVWLSSFLGPETTGRYSTVDHPTVKFTKVVIFAMMMTHIITERKKFDGLLWLFVFISLFLGHKAWTVPRSSYLQGRLEGVGGADFAESNFFAGFMASMLPLIGVQLLRSKKWYGKAICAVSAAFSANAVVLTRSRGGFVGVAAGALMACIFAPKRHRKKIAVMLVLGVLGGIYVADEQFLARLTTISADEEDLDESAGSRFRLWRAGGEMLIDRPLGIGIGNWYQTIGDYIPDYAGKDCHSTYVKIAAELGVQGAIVFALIILIGFKKLRQIRKKAEALPRSIGNDFIMFSFGLTVSWAALFASGLTVSMCYMEFLWMLLMLPVCLNRAFENTLKDYETTKSSDEILNK